MQAVGGVGADDGGAGQAKATGVVNTSSGADFLLPVRIVRQGKTRADGHVRLGLHENHGLHRVCDRVPHPEHRIPGLVIQLVRFEGQWAADDFRVAARTQNGVISRTLMHWQWPATPQSFLGEPGSDVCTPLAQLF